MTFVASTAPDITEGIPTEISTRSTAATTQRRGRVGWDVSVGGLGFILAASDSNPYQRSSAPVQKQQIDTSAEAGEQTLDGYWIRSQTSWHYGAGANFYEPGSNDQETLPTRFRYSESVGVDPWTEGDLTLLKKTVKGDTTVGTSPYVAGVKLSDGTDAYFTSDNSVLKRITAAGAATTYANGASSTSQTRVAVAGSSVLVGDTNGIHSAAISGSPTLAPLWPQATGTLVTPWWVKSRIIAARANVLYELTMAGGTLDGTTPKLMTHPDSSWTWTDVAEAPGAILAAGYSGGVGEIYAFTLKDSGTAGGTPTLSNGFKVAEFPPGEEVHSLRTYLGAYVGIGTSRGVRVGLVDATGQIQYGPLLVKTTSPVKALAARDSFIYAAVTGDIDGGSGCARIDLGATIGGDSLVFPWAYDAQTHTSSTISSMCFIGTTERVVLAAGADGFYAQSATVYETSGYLVSGSIRYGTTEPKSFRSVDLRCRTATGGSVSISTVDPGGSVTSLITLSQGKAGSNISLTQLPEGLEYLSYKIELFSDTSTHAITPTLESVALKALPAVAPQRLIRYPVKLEDRQQDAQGAKFGHDGYAAEAVAALEDYLANHTVVQVEDYTMEESYQARVESFDFTRTTPVAKGRAGKNFGGIGQITVRKLL